MRLKFSAGLGDFLQVDGFWPDYKKAGLQSIHYTDPRRRVMVERLMNAVPEYQHVTHHDFEPGIETDEGVFAHHHILHRLPFYGSTFLRHKIAEVRQDLKPFVLIQASTPFSAEFGRDRDMKPVEWLPILRRLDQDDLTAIVVNADSATKPPKSLRILDLTGLTNVAESIELLKHPNCKGYWGIDSWLAILAPQVHQPDRLWIRCTNPYLFSNPTSYYAPHKTFPFLVPAFGEAPHEIPDYVPGVIVKLLETIIALPYGFEKGELIEIPHDLAVDMVGKSQAEFVESIAI